VAVEAACLLGRHEGRGFSGPGKRIVRGSPTQKKRAYAPVAEW